MYRWIRCKVERQAYVSYNFGVLHCECCLKTKHFHWTSSHGVYQRRSKHVTHSLKRILSLPDIVFHTASAYTSHQLYFARNALSPFIVHACRRGFASRITGAHRFFIQDIRKVKYCQISHSQSVSVDDKPTSDRQLVATTHTHSSKVNIFWPWIGLDFWWPLACTSGWNCIYCIPFNTAERLNIVNTFWHGKNEFWWSEDRPWIRIHGWFLSFSCGIWHTLPHLFAHTSAHVYVRILAKEWQNPKCLVSIRCYQFQRRSVKILELFYKRLLIL